MIKYLSSSVIYLFIFSTQHHYIAYEWHLCQNEQDVQDEEEKDDDDEEENDDKDSKEFLYNLYESVYWNVIIVGHGKNWIAAFAGNGVSVCVSYCRIYRSTTYIHVALSLQCVLIIYYQSLIFRAEQQNDNNNNNTYTNAAADFDYYYYYYHSYSLL